jgi:hypothetical protein
MPQVTERPEKDTRPVFVEPTGRRRRAMRWAAAALALVCGSYGLLIAVSVLGVPLGPFSSLPGAQPAAPATDPPGAAAPGAGGGGAGGSSAASGSSGALGSGGASGSPRTASGTAVTLPRLSPSPATSTQISLNGGGNTAGSGGTPTTGGTSSGGTATVGNGNGSGPSAAPSGSGTVNPVATGRSGALPSTAADAPAFSPTHSPGVTSADHANPASVAHPTPAAHPTTAPRP